MSWNSSEQFDPPTFYIDLLSELNASSDGTSSLTAANISGCGRPNGSSYSSFARNQTIVLIITLTMALAVQRLSPTVTQARQSVAQASGGAVSRSTSAMYSTHGSSCGTGSQRRPHASGARLSCVQILLVHNCLADICFGLFGLLPLLIEFYWTAGTLWGDSAVMCKFMRYMTIMPMLSSPFLLVAISIDRYQAICRPLSVLHRSTSARRPRSFAIGAWLCAAVCSTPQLFAWRVHSGRCRSVGIPDGSPWHSVYSIYFVMLVWFVPTLVTAYCYGCVCCTLFSTRSGRLRYGNRGSAVRKLGATHDSVCSNATERSLGEQPDVTRDYVLRLRSSGIQHERHAELHQRKMDTIKLNVCIVLSNFLLWSPHSVATIVWTVWTYLIGDTTSAVSPRILITYAMLMGNLNSCVSPWIYVMFNWSTVKHTVARTLDWCSRARKTRRRSRAAASSSTDLCSMERVPMRPLKPSCQMDTGNMGDGRRAAAAHSRTAGGTKHRALSVPYRTPTERVL